MCCQRKIYIVVTLEDSSETFQEVGYLIHSYHICGGTLHFMRRRAIPAVLFSMCLAAFVLLVCLSHFYMHPTVVSIIAGSSSSQVNVFRVTPRALLIVEIHLDKHWKH